MPFPHPLRLVRVAQAMPGGEMVRTYLKRGSFSGEIGLIHDLPRQRDVFGAGSTPWIAQRSAKACRELIARTYSLVRHLGRSSGDRGVAPN